MGGVNVGCVFTNACRDVVAVSSSAERRSAILLVLAMIIHWHREGSGVFASHHGFLTQLSRRWRGLTDMHSATYQYPNGGRAKRVYRDANRQQTKALGGMLCDGLGRCAFSIVVARAKKRRGWIRSGKPTSARLCWGNMAV